MRFLGVGVALAVVAAGAGLLGCTKTPPVAETVIVPASAGAGATSAPTPSASTSAITSTVTGEGDGGVKVIPQSEWRDGAVVVVRGKVSKMPAQHLIGSVAGKKDHYFDVTGGSQTVVYAASIPACTGELELRGKVLEVKGASKRPGDTKETKADSSYRELHVDVDEARCLGGSSDVIATGPVTFEVKPLAGPGSMGPTTLSPKSDAALNEVVRYLADHPEITKVTIEGHVNGLKMSSLPNAKRGTDLAMQVAAWLVKHGVDCRRLEAMGRLDPDPDSPAERIRFKIVRPGAARLAGDVYADPCKP